MNYSIFFITTSFLILAPTFIIAMWRYFPKLVQKTIYMILIYTITIVFLITLFDAYLNIRYGITFTDIYYTDGYSLKYDVNASENKNFTLYDKPPYSLE